MLPQRGGYAALFWAMEDDQDGVGLAYQVGLLLEVLRTGEIALVAAGHDDGVDVGVRIFWLEGKSRVLWLEIARACTTEGERGCWVW